MLLNEKMKHPQQKQAIPDFAAVCRDSFTVYNGLHINMSQCNALIQK